MLETVPWFIGGGAEHSPAVARMLAYSATGGGNGVSQWSDLEVKALDIPGTAVRVMPGGAVLRNAYPGGGQQSYIIRNMSQTDVPITATTSGSGATKYVIVRVDDPEFGGQMPANVVDGPYVRFVVVTSISNLNYPHAVLAKIVQPAATGTITASMISSMRTVANPRSKREVLVGAGTAGNLATAANAWKVWPGFNPTVAVPSWATRVEGFARIHQPSIAGGGTFGTIKITLGTLSGDGVFDFNQSGTWADGMRVGTLSLAIAATIPEEMRGTTQPLQFLGTRVNGEGGYLSADAATGVEYDLNFEERPL